jgi:hypothetical protein
MTRFKIGQRCVPRSRDGRYALVIAVSAGGREGTLTMLDANDQAPERENHSAERFEVGWRLAS